MQFIKRKFLYFKSYQLFHSVIILINLFFLIIPYNLFATEINEFSQYFKNNERCFKSNGIPNHKTGNFPKKSNPNSPFATTLLSARAASFNKDLSAWNVEKLTNLASIFRSSNFNSDCFCHYNLIDWFVNLL